MDIYERRPAMNEIVDFGGHWTYSSLLTPAREHPSGILGFRFVPLAINMSYSLNSSKGGGGYIGEHYRGYPGDTRNVDYRSYVIRPSALWPSFAPQPYKARHGGVGATGFRVEGVQSIPPEPCRQWIRDKSFPRAPNSPK